jgi:expansin (peptidoglycan-binding protein)
MVAACRSRTTLLGLVVVLSLLTACRIMPGNTYTGDGTFYAGDGSGNCGYPAGPDVLYAAMNHEDYETARACGAYIRATGPDGAVTVRIVDRCPECAPGDVDFSPEAFDLIADPVDGRVPISWELVSGPVDLGNVQYVAKDGANPWWFAIQPRQHRNLVTTLEVDVDGSWVALERLEYNYFVASSGLGSGPFTIRLTDVHGEQLVHTGITLSPTVVQTTDSQFAAH